MHERLAALAPWAALEIDLNDRSRVLRALELHEAGVLSPRDTPSELWSEDLRHPTLLIGLVMERGALYEAIDARVDAMLARVPARRSHWPSMKGRLRPHAGRSASASFSPATWTA